MSMKKLKQEKRPSSDDFVELHVFVVPYELWMEKYRTAYNSSTLESISAGFVRVPLHLTLEDLRFQIKEQLSYGDVLPEEYVFLRSVGRCLAIVNKVQELSLKVKHFLPPVVSSPEIFVLFGNHNGLSHTLTSSINTASDLPEYETVRGYLTYSREMGENSSYFLPERGKTEQLDQTDAIERRVHFQQNDQSKNGNVDDSERAISGNVVRKLEGTYLTELPPATKTKFRTSEEQQHTRRLSNSAQDNQKSRNANEQISSELPMDQNVQYKQANPDEVNSIQLQVNTSENREESRDTTLVSSRFEAQHVESPRNKVQRKNPLVHSKTVPSLLQNSCNQNNDEENEGSELNERITETIFGDKENPGICNNKRETENDRSKECSHHLELNNKNESETMDKTRDDYKIPADLEGDGSKSSYQIELANENGNNFADTKVVDSTNENIKHSAEHSVASSGFESLNQSNNNVNERDIEHNKKEYGVTIADKENLVLQLQAELNAVRSERSNSEKAREQLLKKAKNLQNQNNQKRNQAKSVWKKKYFEEKKKTVSLEERCNQLRYEVEVIHKRILSSDDSKDRDSATAYLNKDGDPKTLNAKITLTRKENEVEELRRRVEEAKIKLGSEMKLRDNAQKELKQIRDEVTDKKINATLVKKSLSLLETRPTDP